MSPAADSIGGEVLLQATDVAKTFGGLKAVDNVTFALRAGIITTLVGPNGAGKTTLFNLMTGHLVPDQGEVLWLGKSILRLPHWKIARLGIGRSFQDLKLFANMTVEENVCLLYTSPSPRDRQKSRMPSSA